MVQVQWKSMHRDDTHIVEDAQPAKKPHEVGIDRRHSPESDFQLWIHSAYGLGCSDDHAGEDLPLRILMEIPMRKIIRLIPQHYGFNHTRLFPLRGPHSVPSNSRSRI